MSELKRKNLAILISIMLFSIFISGCTEETPTENKPMIVYVSINGSEDFSNIQEAIEYLNPGGTIFVKNGIYHETLIINKSITLIGENKDTTIISCIINDNASSDSIIFVNADSCNIRGFNITCKYFSSSIVGIFVNSTFNNITNNIINNYNKGIYLSTNSKNNNITENTILNSKYGIDVYGSVYNNILRNNISLSSVYGLFVHGSNDNIVSQNLISNNSYGIRFTSSHYNELISNSIIYNKGGLRFCCSSRNNIIFKNIFMQNQNWNAVDDISNTWDNGSIGNYWDDYQEKYPNANNSNGIWDTPYIITGDNIDRFPLVNPPKL